MNIFDFFKRKEYEPPAVQIEDPILGELNWDEDSESWLNEISGIEVCISYDGKATPSEHLLSAAYALIQKPELSSRILQDTKNEATSIYKNKYQEELRQLKIISVYVYSHKKAPNSFMMLVNFSDGNPQHDWGADFKGFDLQGVGLKL